MQTDKTCVALSHIITTTLGKHQTAAICFFCQSPRPVVSHPSSPSIIIGQTILSPFKWQVDKALYAAAASQAAG